MQGFAYTNLYCPQPRDCTQAPICVAVDGSACASGSVLVDTGIPQMYLTVPPSLPVKSHLAPDLSDPQRQVPVLQDGSRVTVRFGAPDAMAFYSFVVGQMNPVQPMQPAQVILTPAHTPAFVNTGRHFLRNFDVLFDADGGSFGLRWTGPAGSTQGGLIPGSSY